MWIFLYWVHLSDPGYLEQETLEYYDALKKVTCLNLTFRTEINF
jgi:hypothetical protein